MKMDESQKEIEEKKKELKELGGSIDEGDKPKTTELIETSRAERKRMEEAREKQKEENDRTEQLRADQAMSGRAEAGGESKEKTENEKWAEGAKERYEGTGMNPTDDETWN